MDGMESNPVFFISSHLDVNILREGPYLIFPCVLSETHKTNKLYKE